MAKEQIKSILKLKKNWQKLEEFATYNDSLEEVFENKEQIEVSKFMKIAKATCFSCSRMVRW
jgi:Ran GTPase-activating protein (RanGAP) involved in mRNA processing and transport